MVSAMTVVMAGQWLPVMKSLQVWREIPICGRSLVPLSRRGGLALRGGAVAAAC